MTGISPISFYGHGSESTGSVAYANSSSASARQNRINFQAQEDKYEKKDKTRQAVGIIAGLTLLTAGTIVGLGYAHKTDVLSKMKDGKIKDILKKAEPAAKKCHEWCAIVKTKGQETWNKVTNFFQSKKD